MEKEDKVKHKFCKNGLSASLFIFRFKSKYEPIKGLFSGSHFLAFCYAWLLEAILETPFTSDPQIFWAVGLGGTMVNALALKSF